MQRYGFIHDMMYVKVLILYVMSRVSDPVDTQQLYELCYQDECLSYFDVCTAVPELVDSGHLQKVGDEHYEITQKGREHCTLTEDSIAFSVRQRAENAVAVFNRQLRRSCFVKTGTEPRDNGDFTVRMALSNETGTLMTMELMAPNQRQALRLSKLLEKKAEEIYNLTMASLMDEEDQM